MQDQSTLGESHGTGLTRASQTEGERALLADPDLPGLLLAVAEPIARAAGALAARRRREGLSVAATKSSLTDVVTAADREVEAFVRAELARERPDDGFFGEESGEAGSRSGIHWVVDPVDGTVNYLYGHAAYAVSIAAVVGEPGDEPVTYDALAAVVFAPDAGELFLATRGGGATRNGEPISASDADALGSSLVGTGFSYVPEERAAQARAWADLAPSVRDLRRIGAASLDLCGVACGRLDGYYEQGTNPWDHAGGALVARESGAVVTGIRADREGRVGIVAAAPGIAEALRAAVGESFARAGLQS